MFGNFEEEEEEEEKKEKKKKKKKKIFTYGLLRWNDVVVG